MNKVVYNALKLSEYHPLFHALRVLIIGAGAVGTHLMEKYAMNPEESIMIGDRALDVQAGLNAGIAGLAYLDGTGPAFQCPGMLLARSVGELREILLK